MQGLNTLVMNSESPVGHQMCYIKKRNTALNPQGHLTKKQVQVWIFCFILSALSAVWVSVCAYLKGVLGICPCVCSCACPCVSVPNKGLPTGKEWGFFYRSLLLQLTQIAKSLFINYHPNVASNVYGRDSLRRSLSTCGFAAFRKQMILHMYYSGPGMEDM